LPTAERGKNGHRVRYLLVADCGIDGFRSRYCRPRTAGILATERGKSGRTGFGSRYLLADRARSNQKRFNGADSPGFMPGFLVIYPVFSAIAAIRCQFLR
jgi:hypothetical protein